MSEQPAELSGLLPVSGIRLGTAAAGIKRPGRADLVVMELAPGSQCAAVFTRNAFCAAPVTVARSHLERQAPAWLLVNTGNANAGTGDGGLRDALACCAALAEQAGCAATQVLPFSTGVIGEPLPVDRIINGLPAAIAALSAQGWPAAARGILTTDTVPKGASRRIEVDGQALTITGIAKGSGMIRPDMATMLAFIATDAALATPQLADCLHSAVDKSFNRITVDGDTSTNDACVLVATGQSAVPELQPGTAGLAQFRAALDSLCIELAQAIVRDGEGATRFVTVAVEQGRDDKECLDVAYTIAHSPLVKTALFAADPNWGRILAAVGRAGLAQLDITAVEIHLDEVCIVRGGGRADDYTEAAGQAVLQRPEYTIRVVLGRGSAAEQVWTCDLSYDYVKINAEYRT
jgi:glutamate N-acetyltransferase/amino-acid N-acetyltransferase